MRHQSGRTGTEAARRAGERVALLGEAAAFSDASARLAGRAGVAAPVYQAVITGRWVVVHSYWRMRWTGATYHLTLAVAGGGDSVIVEMFLPEGASELVLASSADGKMTINSGALAEWLGLPEASRSAAGAG